MDVLWKKLNLWLGLAVPLRQMGTNYGHEEGFLCDCVLGKLLISFQALFC